MKLVVDTNITISALIKKGFSRDFCFVREFYEPIENFKYVLSHNYLWQI